MKYPLALTAVVVASLGLNNSSYSADGRIYFTGRIVEAACRVNSQIHVDMLSTSLEDLKKAGDKGEAIPFAIELTQCPEVTKAASIKFQAIPNAENPQLIQTSGTAEGVGIELIDAANQQRLELKGGETGPSSTTQLKTDATNSLNFKARYVSTSSIVKPGSASGFADFVITYY